jgi:membrane protease YdiL (CAAX protease family)
MATVSDVPALAPLFLNSPQEIEKRLGLGQIRWAAPLLFLPARIVFMLLSQAIFAAVFGLRGRASPWQAAGAWWTVWGTLVDVGCLACLFFLTRRENLRIRDLLGPLPRWLVLKGLACFALIFPFFLLGGPLASWLVYHSWQGAPMTPGVAWGRHLPLWGVLHSLLIWWPIWSVTEELTYNGYLASRFAALSRYRWISYSLVGFWWALQHAFLPFIPDWRFVLYRFLAFLPGVLVLLAIYLRTRRLAPLIVAHWMMDIIAAIMTLSF